MPNRFHNFSLYRAQRRYPSLSCVATSARLFGLIATLFAVLLVLVASPESARADVEAADGDLLQGITIRHQIDFGNSIEIQLEADINFAVNEVRAVFAPVGVRRVSSYSYPQFRMSADGRRLNADFAIRTGGSAYVPPGTEFELFFEITGTDGSLTSTHSERILYLDPAKDWRQLSSPGIPLDFHYYGFSESSAQGLADRVSDTWLNIADAIGVDVGSVERFRAVIYPNASEMNSVFPPTSAAASDGIFFGGFAMQRFGVFVLGGPWPDSVIHELTHLMIDTRVSSPLSPGVPSWLHEGLAQFFEAGNSSTYTSQLSNAASSDRLLTLRNRNTVPSRGSEIGLFYTQVGSFVGELIEDNGPEPMAETLRLINEGNTAAEAVEIAYGKPLWELENEWRTKLGASELPPQPTATPSDVGQTQATATPEATVVDGAGVAASGPSDNPDSAPLDAPDDGFNWTGPLIGIVAAAVVFGIWSFRVNRRRYRSFRR